MIDSGIDAAVQEAVAELRSRRDAAEDIVKKIDFLAEQTALLAQQLADRDSGRLQRRRYRHHLQRWARRLPQEPAEPATGAAPAPAPRALIIDDRMPKADRDAGSSAILSHMSSLRQLGYELTFAPALELEPVEMDVTALDAIGARESRERGVRLHSLFVCRSGGPPAAPTRPENGFASALAGRRSPGAGLSL